MINITIKAHRKYLLANTADPQKLFVMIKVIPGKEVAAVRPPVSIVLVVDTSGSMYSFADQEKSTAMIQQRGLTGVPVSRGDDGATGYDLDLPSKLDQAIKACKKFVQDARLTTEDQLAVINFDTDANTLLPLQPLTNRDSATTAVDSLSEHSGDTWMAKGINLAREQVTRLPTSAAKRVILFTDGATADEPECRQAAGSLAEINCPVAVVGLGDEYNAELLSEIASISCGRVYPLEDIEDFDATIQTELGSSIREVITDLRLNLSAVKGVSLNSIVRVFPSLAEMSAAGLPIKLGNIEKGDYTVFIAELTIQGLQRPPSEARLARLLLSGEAPALGRTYESPPQDVRVEFTPDQAAVQDQKNDEEVMSYVQQRNVDSLTQQAVTMAKRDPEGATRLLEQAQSITRRLGNSSVTRQLKAAADELKSTGSLSGKTQRITSLGGRTKTVRKDGEGVSDLPSSDEIRRASGV